MNLDPLTGSWLQVVVAAEIGGALGGMVRQLSIDQFENEGRRVSYGTPENAIAARKLLDRQVSIDNVSKKVDRRGFKYSGITLIFYRSGLSGCGLFFHITIHLHIMSFYFYIT